VYAISDKIQHYPILMKVEMICVKITAYEYMMAFYLQKYGQRLTWTIWWPFSKAWKLQQVLALCQHN
jgi:hypothetical protein